MCAPRTDRRVASEVWLRLASMDESFPLDEILPVPPGTSAFHVRGKNYFDFVDVTLSGVDDEKGVGRASGVPLYAAAAIVNQAIGITRSAGEPGRDRTDP